MCTCHARDLVLRLRAAPLAAPLWGVRLQPKQYVAGSKQDQTGSTPTLAIGIVAGLIAVAVAFLGLSGNKEISRASAPTPYAPDKPCPCLRCANV